MIGIYKFTNRITGKSYIGQSKNIERRYRDHEFCCGEDSYFHRMIKRYGFINFDFEVLEECDPNCLNEREIYYISKYNTVFPDGYNIDSGGNNKAIKFNKLKNLQDVKDIIFLLSNTSLTNTKIAEMFNLSPQFISQINTGESWTQKDISYPIRNGMANYKNLCKTNREISSKKCSCCGKELSNNNSVLCLDCSKNEKSKHIPSKEILYDLLKENTFIDVGRMFNVTDNTVRKWCIKYGLPKHSSYYRNLAS